MSLDYLPADVEPEAGAGVLSSSEKGLPEDPLEIFGRDAAAVVGNRDDAELAVLDRLTPSMK